MIALILSIVIYLIIATLTIWNWATGRKTPLGFEMGIGGASLVGAFLCGFAIYSQAK